MEKKYELTDETIEYSDATLHRIRALRDFGDVKAGDLGGYIEKEDNLSHEGNCWVYDDAEIYGDAKVRDDAKILDDASIFGNAKIYGRSRVYGDATVFGNAEIYGDVIIYDTAIIFGNAKISNNSRICGFSRIYDNAQVYGFAILDNVRVCDDSIICNTSISNSSIRFDAKIEKKSDYLAFEGFDSCNRIIRVYRNQNGGITVVCGCFAGTLYEFEKQVKETHGDNKYAKEYLTLINAIKIHFGIE